GVGAAGQVAVGVVGVAALLGSGVAPAGKGVVFGFADQLVSQVVTVDRQPPFRVSDLAQVVAGVVGEAGDAALGVGDLDNTLQVVVGVGLAVAFRIGAAGEVTGQVVAALAQVGLVVRLLPARLHPVAVVVVQGLVEGRVLHLLQQVIGVLEARGVVLAIHGGGQPAPGVVGHAVGIAPGVGDRRQAVGLVVFEGGGVLVGISQGQWQTPAVGG